MNGEGALVSDSTCFLSMGRGGASRPSSGLSGVLGRWALSVILGSVVTAATRVAAVVVLRGVLGATDSRLVGVMGVDSRVCAVHAGCWDVKDSLGG